MKMLKKQIKESFFNPIFHFFPLIIFLLVDEFWGISTAWNIALPASLVLLVYVYVAHKRIFIWHLIFTVVFMAISSVAMLQFILPIPSVIQPISYKLIVFCYALFLIIFRTLIETKAFAIMSKLIPMSNNFNELYRVVWALFIGITVYISIFVALHYYPTQHSASHYKLLSNFYALIAAIYVVYEVLRVQIIRTKLGKEEWWPIVNENGKIIGSIEHSTSLWDKKKYTHPIVRTLIIEKSMVFLQKNNSDDLISPGLWDTAISAHVKMGETIDQSVEKAAVERYTLNNFKYIYLSNYLYENKQEQHYAFLFVSCQNFNQAIESTSKLQTKWWTQQQIEENLNVGIFSENFKLEFDLLKRSGLLESGKCECSCKLKDVIYQQTDAVKKEQ